MITCIFRRSRSVVPFPRVQLPQASSSTASQNRTSQTTSPGRATSSTYTTKVSGAAKNLRVSRKGDAPVQDIIPLGWITRATEDGKQYLFYQPSYTIDTVEWSTPIQQFNQHCLLYRCFDRSCYWIPCKVDVEPKLTISKRPLGSDCWSCC